VQLQITESGVERVSWDNTIPLESRLFLLEDLIQIFESKLTRTMYMGYGPKTLEQLEPARPR
jgi:hypothetical protein